jgi:hypothetical protein
MRALLVALPLFLLTLFPGSGNAGDRPHQIAVSDSGNYQLSTDPNSETYRNYYFDLTAIAGRQHFAVMADALRHQIDIVEGVGLSPLMLKFFHTIPILVNDVACMNPTPKATNNSKDTEDPKANKDPKALLHPACYDQEPPREMLEGKISGCFGIVSNISGLTRTV